MFFKLMISMYDSPVLLEGEIRQWSLLGFKQLAQTFIDHCNKTSTGNSHIVTLAYFVFCYTRMTQMLFYSLFQANEAFKFVMQRKSTGKVLIKTR